MPKSTSFALPSVATRMLDGLRSRWTTSCLWAHGQSIDVLHDEVRHALGVDAAVE
jgi:hypothetical protein